MPGLETLVAQLHLDISQFTSQLQASTQQFSTFAQTINTQIQSASQSFQTLTTASKTANQELNAETRRARNEQIQIERDAQRSINQAYRQERQQLLEVERDVQRAINQASRHEQQTRLQQERDIQRSINQAFRAEATERATIERETQRSINAAHRAGLEERRAREESINYQITQMQRQHAEQQRRVQRELATERRTGVIGTPSSSPVLTPNLALLQGYQQLLEPLVERQNRFNASLQTMGSILGAAGIAVGITAIVSSLKSVIVESGKAAIQFESLQASFKAIEGSAGRARDVLGFLRRETTRIGVDFTTTSESFKNFEAAARGTKLEGEEARKIFVSMIEVSRVLGLSTDRTRLALLALEQMISKGKISSEELRRQLGEHLPGALGIMARSLNISTAELDKMLKAGTLITEDVLPGFLREAKKTFGPGLEDATKTAAATFARLGNEINALSIEVGNAILRNFSPIANFIEKTLRKSREARDEAKTLQERTIEQALVGYGVKPEDLTEAERYQLFTSQQRARGKTYDLNEFLDAARTRRRRARLDEDIANIESETRGPTPKLFESQIKEVTKLYEEFQKKVTATNLEASLFPGKIDIAADRAREFRKVQEDIAKIVSSTPGLYAQIPDEIKKIITETRKGGDEAERQVQLAKDLKKENNDARREAEQLAKVRADLVADIMQGGTFSLRSRSELQEITADITHFENQLKSSTGPTLEAVSVILAHLYDARQKAFGKLPDLHSADHRAFAESIARINEELRETPPEVEKLNKALQQLASIEGVNKFDELRSKARVTFDQLERDLEGNEEALTRARAARLREFSQISEQETKETQQELAKQQAEYDKFAKGIQDTLSSAFEGILNGSRSIFESIKQLFIKLLADLAAAALTHAVIIPAIVQFFGSGGSGGGGSAFGSLAAVVGGVSGAGGGTTSGDGGGSTFGSILGLAQQGSNLYSSGSTLLSGGKANNSLLNILGQNETIQGILGTPIFGGGVVGTGASFIGAGGGIVGGAFASSGGIGGAALSSGVVLEGAIGGTAGSFAGAGTGGLAGGLSGGSGGFGAAGAGGGTAAGATLGAIAGGALAGIAVGFTLSELNDLLGLKDLLGSRGSSALAGAGGGAVGGALIGTAINPGIGTAIGAIIGTIVGALGGFAFGGSSKPKPKVDIQDVTRPTVTFDDEFGLQTQGKFQVLTAPFRDIGRFDYGKFLGNIDNAVNDLFGQVLDGLRGLSPKVQQAILGPLNDIAAQIEANIEATEFKGKDALEQLQEYFGTKLPEFVNGLLRPLQEAFEKIDPVAKAFEDVIDNANQILIQLAQQEAGVLLSIQAQIHALQEDLFSPAQVFLRRQDELAQVQAFLATASPQEKLAAIPQVQQLVGEIFALGKTPEVLGQDPQLVRDLQASSIQILEDLQATTDQAFGVLGSEVQQQITLAEQQLDTLIASLGNLGSIDNVISESLPVLESIRGALAPYANQDALTTQIQTALTAASVQTLQNIDTTAQAQLTELQSINANLGGIPAATNIGNGSDGGDGGGNAIGLAYVPRNAFYFLHQGEQVTPRHQVHNSDVVVNINGATGDPDAIATAVIAQIERRGGRLASSRIMVSKR